MFQIRGGACLFSSSEGTIGFLLADHSCWRKRNVAYQKRFRLPVQVQEPSLLRNELELDLHLFEQRGKCHQTARLTMFLIAGNSGKQSCHERYSSLVSIKT